MVPEINARVLELRESLGLTQEKFGERLNFSQDTISIIERGKRKVHDRMINAIVKEFHVSENWLRNGKGDMYRDITKNLDIRNSDIERLISKIVQLDEYQLKSIEGLVDNCITLYKNREDQK